ncbi:PREDICTED: uncharacterized protein LOC104732080 isoform X2 [Camelina sativa]|uniref:Uncharacterized protein LOC104732080 isoform X2 n=1 Tax=Camelina sativa TaxID=90675 RepID=A0ABM1QSR5_CAMSA|nr:PREDICTED: uncharacterized protein LOC104732080 isoform X2 [Camelina sativa]
MSNVAGDQRELVFPPLKKAKTDRDATELVCPSDPEEEEIEIPAMRNLRKGNWDDPEYAKQRRLFQKQFKESEGYDVDWDSMDYNFPGSIVDSRRDYDDQLSNKELMKLLIKTAIDEENEEAGTQLKFVKYVTANVVAAKGFLFFITFWAKDLSAPNPEPKCYQAEVLWFMGDADVYEFRLRPTK